MSRRRLILNLLNRGSNSMEKIFEADFVLDETVTSNAYTTIATLNTGFSQDDFAEGEILISEIRLIDDLEPDETICKQMDRFEFLFVGGFGYCSALYSGNPTLGKADNTEVYSEFDLTAAGVFVYKAGKWMNYLTIAARQNGSPKPTAGRYKLLLYRTGFNFIKDYRE